ncbi:uncharacterized protein TNCV_3323361 [Trichonephila clavipes]|nr:uncharacterized protein TNCV_3323361 [Trichonephila clavipes]
MIIIMTPDDDVGDGERMVLLSEIVGKKGFLESISPTFRDTPLKKDMREDRLRVPAGSREQKRVLGVGLLHDRWRHHLSPFPQFRHGTGGKGNILQPSAHMVSAVTAHKTFGLADLTSTYSVCTRRVFSGIRHRTKALRCSNH